MTSRKAADIRVETLRCESGDGYALLFDDGIAVNYCAAVVDGVRLKCVSGSVPSGAALSVAEQMDGAEEDPRADVPWAFAMAGAASVHCLMDALRVPHVDRDATAPAIAAVVGREAASSLQGLDSEALAVLAACPVKRTGALAFYSGADERAVRRRQAAASYPLLADILSASLSAKMAIDRSRPLADTVLQTLGGLVNHEVTKPVLKRIAAARSLPDGCSLETVVRFMTLVPADWIPAAGGEWEAFCHAGHALLEDLDCGDDAVPALIKGCGGKWTEFCGRIVKKAGMAEGDELWGARRAMFNASEMIGCFADVGVLPMAAHASPSSTVTVTPEMMHAATKVSFAMLAAGRSASDLADLQRRWHQERAAILDGTRVMEMERVARVRGEIEEGGWPPLSSTVQAPNGLWLVPLTNPDELAREGAPGPDQNGVDGLSHCVGGYASRAKSCDCHIVSVRQIDEDGKYSRVTTAEFNALRPDSDALGLKQNLARGNASAPPESKDAVNWYMASVANGLIKLNRAQISAFLDNELVPDDGVERICGYDWRDRDMLNAGVGPWGPFVSTAFRNQGLDAIMDGKEIASVSALVSPDILLAAGR